MPDYSGLLGDSLIETRLARWEDQQCAILEGVRETLARLNEDRGRLLQQIENLEAELARLRPLAEVGEAVEGMTDDLRLRTMRALGYVREEQVPKPNGLVSEIWLCPTGLRTCMVYDTNLGDYRDSEEYPPEFGTTWASCEEIDAAIKEKGWEYEVYISRYRTTVTIWKPNPTPTIESEMVVAGGGGAPTFPAAFALAFCEAVEAGGE